MTEAELAISEAMAKLRDHHWDKVVRLKRAIREVLATVVDEDLAEGLDSEFLAEVWCVDLWDVQERTRERARERLAAYLDKAERRLAAYLDKAERRLVDLAPIADVHNPAWDALITLRDGAADVRALLEVANG